MVPWIRAVFDVVGEDAGGAGLGRELLGELFDGGGEVAIAGGVDFGCGAVDGDFVELFDGVVCLPACELACSGADLEGEPGGCGVGE